MPRPLVNAAAIQAVIKETTEDNWNLSAWDEHQGDCIREIHLTREEYDFMFDYIAKKRGTTAADLKLEMDTERATKYAQDSAMWGFMEENTPDIYNACYRRIGPDASLEDFYNRAVARMQEEPQPA